MKQTPTQTNRARELRKNFTDAEDLIWYLLRNRRLCNHKFKRQVPMGKYIVDFVCYHKKIIIELDGGQHADNIEYDVMRTKFLEQKGFRVIRFWNNQVFLETEAVVEEIMKALGCL